MNKPPAAPSPLPETPAVHGYVPAFDTADGNEDPAPPAVTDSTLPEAAPDSGTVNAPPQKAAEGTVTTGQQVSRGEAG